MKRRRPSFVIIGGPNGAGKSTSGPALVRDTLGVDIFVNADTIAAGLSAFSPETVALEAGRVLLRRIEELGKVGETFAFETTLANRGLPKRIEKFVRDGYAFHLVFLWLPSPELAVSRVKGRVRLGGHDISEEVIRRRYASGLRNFRELYLPLADTWSCYDSSSVGRPEIIAQGDSGDRFRVFVPETWKAILEFQGS